MGSRQSKLLKEMCLKFPEKKKYLHSTLVQQTRNLPCEFEKLPDGVFVISCVRV